MRRRNLNEIETPAGTHSPVIPHSRDGEDRVVLLEIAPGQRLGEHGVSEAGSVLLVEGRVRVETRDGSVDAGRSWRHGPARATPAASVSAS